MVNASLVAAGLSCAGSVVETAEGRAGAVSGLISLHPDADAAAKTRENNLFRYVMAFVLTSQTNSRFGNRARRPAYETARIRKCAIPTRSCRGLPCRFASRHRRSPLQPVRKTPATRLVLPLSGYPRRLGRETSA